MILHNHVSETSYNVALTIEETVYVVTYGHQREEYPKTPKGLMQALDEYISCVEHAKDSERR